MWRNIPEWRKSMRDSSKKRFRKKRGEFEKAAARLRGLGTEVEIKLLPGSVFDELVTAAVDCKGRAMVVGAVGHGLARRLLVGSVAEQTAETSPIPTLVVRPGGRLGSWLRGEHPLKILVAYDFSPASDAALRWVNELQQIGPCHTTVLHVDSPPHKADRLGYHGPQGLHYAVGLAQLFGAELTVLTVVQLHHDLPPVVVYTHSELSRWAREVAQAHMDDLVSTTDFGEVKYEAAIKMGSPAQKIRRYAPQTWADLIVTATHGRTGLRHVLIGSTPEQIVRYARSPVLVVPSRERAEG
jgi:universal stress protein A